ncbi:MAG: hypothetical protein ABIW79_07155, partial [Gemmatimonas sp.]
MAALIGISILVLVAGVLAFIGLLSAVRGTPVEKVLPLGDQLPAIDDPAFRTSMELLSRSAMCLGNKAEIFWNGDQTYPRLWNDLRAATKTITLQLYYCEPGR